MKDQHTKIKGYRDLSQAEIDLMNELKAKGEELQQLLDKAQDHVHHQMDTAANSDEVRRIHEAQPKRWLSIARTDFQTGLMAAIRAVAQPTTF